MNTTSGRICDNEGCNASLDGEHPLTKYCATCAIEREKESKKIWQQKNYNRKRRKRNTNGRDPNSTASRLLKKLGKPKSYIERCY